MKEIRNIIATYEDLDWETEKVALASVVNVEESSYRRIGARMLVRSSGQWVGGISGGCLEGDALKRSQKAIFKNEPSRVVYDTMEDDQNQIGVGLGCNGRIEVLFTPIDPANKANEIEVLKSFVHADSPRIIIKVIDHSSDDLLLGQIRLIDESNGSQDFVNINGYSINESIQTVVGRKKSKIFELKDKDDNDVKVLVEFIRPETHLIVVGDNYDVISMLGIARELGWKTSIVGRKKKFSKQVYSLASNVIEYEEAHTLKVNDYTAVLLMTHDYNWDKKMIPIFVNQNPKYIGMLGPKKRLIKMQGDLPEVDFENLSYFHSPTGLEIGAESPAEIALSMAAEIVAIFRDKTGSSLKYKEGTIHERDID